MSTSVAWSSSAASVAGISPSGVAFASKTGGSTITASDGSIHGSASLTVTAAPLISIAISPAAPSVGAGATLQLKAVGIFQDGSTQDLTNAVGWATTTPNIASISATGLLLGIKAGTSQAVASSGSIRGSATVSVTPAALVSLAISPLNASIARQTTEQFSAVGTFADGHTQDLTAAVTWSSSAAGVATVSVGLASALQAGSTVITATSGSLSASAGLAVTNASAVSLAVTPVNPSLVVGLFQQFTATGTFSDGSTQDVSAVATWSSSVPAVAAANSAGLVSAVTPGAATVSAFFETVSGNSTVAVESPSLVSISVTPASPTIANTTTQSFAVVGHYSDGSTQTLTSASWSSSDPSVAAMNGNVAVSKQPGTTTITANFGSFTATTSLTVSSATLTSIALIPANPSIAPTTTKTFAAAATFSDGSTQYISGLAGWASSNTAVATMQGNTASAVNSGSSTISASFDSVTGSTTLNVSPVTLSSLAITPLNPILVIGATQQLTAKGTFSDGSTQNLTSLVNWSSSQPSVASTDMTGIVTGQTAGTATLSARYGPASASTSVTVSGATLVALTVKPSTAAVAPGFTKLFSATGTYSDGTIQNVTSMAHWASSDSTVATVGNSGTSGQVTGVNPGWTRISAVLDSVIASAVVNVNTATLVSIAISPSDPALTLGNNQQFTATGTFSDGSIEDISQWVTWISSSSQVCVVNSSGYAITSGSGTATISASFGSVSATTTISVY